MGVYYCGVSDRELPIELREQISFTRSQVSELNARLSRIPGIRGCVLLSTCNRTELYCSCDEGYMPDGPGLLCAAAGVERSLFAGVFQWAVGQAAVRHLLEVSTGLRSRIWGEDQILSQVRQALTLSRTAGGADPVLETLFRTAVSAGKEFRTKVRLSDVSPSSAARAVEVLEGETGGLRGKRALVIGNGEMGRLSARLLLEAGCEVTITLRTYRHGETVVPAGCAVVPYEDRYSAMENMDILLSATISPHYTLSAAKFRQVIHPPRYLADLAIPRDIEPAVENRQGIILYNIDSLGGSVVRDIPETGEEILRHAMERFDQWAGYRASLPAMEELGDAVLERVLSADVTSLSPQESAELAVKRTIELLTGNLKGALSAEDLALCAQKVRAHTRL